MDDSMTSVVHVPLLSSLEIGHEAVCFAALASKSMGTTKYGDPFWRCAFRDKHGSRDLMIWGNDPLCDLVKTWEDGHVFRIRVRAKSGQRGVELKLIEIRPIADGDEAEGYVPANLYEVSRFPIDECAEAVLKLARENIRDPHLIELVSKIFAEFDQELRRHPAASSMHHAFTGGLMEHIRSIAGICAYLARHYAKYYDELDPPLNKDLIVAAGILHDIGKLFELEYHPVSARYTTVGNLIGHIVIGRDMIRKTAATIDGFPQETLLQLEHAVLAHHGKKEFGAPVLPQTIEAFIVSFADELDAKINQAVRARVRSQTSEAFTEDVFYGVERRKIYKGVRLIPESRNGDHAGEPA